jgi:hypothetical protein
VILQHLVDLPLDLLLFLEESVDNIHFVHLSGCILASPHDFPSHLGLQKVLDHICIPIGDSEANVELRKAPSGGLVVLSDAEIVTHCEEHASSEGVALGDA